MDSENFEYHAELFVWGSGADGQLGLGDKRYVTTCNIVSWELVPKVDYFIIIMYLPFHLLCVVIAMNQQLSR